MGLDWSLGQQEGQVVSAVSLGRIKAEMYMGSW